MIRVMIVEDDLLFRRQMRNMLDWQALGMSICAEYSDGREALKHIAEDTPALILTDISMPGMNGIELIAAVKAEYPEVRMLALSSHDDYKFVKDALKLGADDYILKQDISTEMDQFIRVLQEAKERIMPDDAGKADGERQLMLEAIMLHVIDGSLTNRNEIRRKLHRLMVFFPFERYVTAIIIARDARVVTDIRNGERRFWQPDGEAAHGFRREVVALTEPAAQSRMAFMINDHTGVCLFNVKGIFSQSRINNMIRASLTRAFNDQLAYSIGLSLQVEGIAAFAQSCMQARAAAEDGFLYAEQAIAEYQESSAEKSVELSEAALKHADIVPWKEQPEEWTKRLVQAVYEHKFRITALQQLFDQLEARLFQYTGKDDRSLRDILRYDHFPLRLIAKSQNMDVLIHYLIQCLRRALENETILIRTDNIHIQKAISYIHTHISSSFGLQEVAEALDINGNYLSNLFKQETGIRFMTYVNDVRIMHAKRLMADKDMRIYEVAHACGFQNVEYFSRLFKEKVGYSPTRGV